MNSEFSTLFSAIATEVVSLFGEEIEYYQTGIPLSDPVLLTATIQDIPQLTTSDNDSGIFEYRTQVRIARESFDDVVLGDIIKVVSSGKSYVLTHFDDINTNEVIVAAWMRFVL